MSKNNITLIVKPTHKCNLSCPYCYDTENRKKCNYGDKMSMEIVSKIAEVFKDDAAQWIWHGGEPLLMGPEFYYEANDLILSKMNKIKIDIQTNGTLINEEFIKMFKKYHMAPGLSFDGINNQSTRKDTARLMKVFRLLETSNIPFGAITVLTHNSIDNIISEYEYSKRLGVSTQMNLIFNVAGNELTENLSSDVIVEHMCKFFDYWIHDTDHPVMSELCMSYVNRLIGGRMFCSDIDCVGKWFAIHPDGTLHPCGRDWGVEESFGNIMDYNSVEEIKQHPNFIRFYSETRQLLDECSTCDFFYACHGGCYGNAHTFHNNFKHAEPSACDASKKILTHVYNTIKNIDMSDTTINPLFLRVLVSRGLRPISELRRISNESK